MLTKENKEYLNVLLGEKLLDAYKAEHYIKFMHDSPEGLRLPLVMGEPTETTEELFEQLKAIRRDVILLEDLIKNLNDETQGQTQNSEERIIPNVATKDRFNP